MNKSLDKAIMLLETSEKPSLEGGYVTETGTYDAYMNKLCWQQFKCEMEKSNPQAFKDYGKGGGKELDERKERGKIYPPKMASFGSSSRMIYSLLHDVEGFLFEKKLHTSVGGTAHLDGFMEKDDKCIFIEAKCREPYGDKEKNIRNCYKSLYEKLLCVSCDIRDGKKDHIQVNFKVGSKTLEYFDTKQMICHLLGIAAAYLKGEYNKPIEFIYLLYNPLGLDIKNKEHKEKISEIYQAYCDEWNSVDWKSLFLEILTYLQDEKGLGKDKDVKSIAQGFTYNLCDQFTIRNSL